jgi:hypothetical protein
MRTPAAVACAVAAPAAITVAPRLVAGPIGSTPSTLEAM